MSDLAVSGASNSALASAIQQTTGNASLGEHDFLQLLVTQMTNQDPTQPQDQTQLLAQLAQFSTVEGVNNMATAQSHLQAADMLGKTITATVVNNSVAQPTSGTVTSVSWDANGVHLGLDNNTSVTLDQVTQISN